MTKDGSYALDTARLSAALAANPGAVVAMYTNGVHGVYASLESTSLSLTDQTDPGSLTGAVTRYTGLQTSITAQQASVATEQESLRSQLVSHSPPQTPRSWHRIAARTEARRGGRMIARGSPGETYRRIDFDARASGATPAELTAMCYQAVISGLGRALIGGARGDNRM